MNWRHTWIINVTGFPAVSLLHVDVPAAALRERLPADGAHVRLLTCFKHHDHMLICALLQGQLIHKCIPKIRHKNQCIQFIYTYENGPDALILLVYNQNWDNTLYWIIRTARVMWPYQSVPACVCADWNIQRKIDRSCPRHTGRAFHLENTMNWNYY